MFAGALRMGRRDCFNGAIGTGVGTFRTSGSSFAGTSSFRFSGGRGVGLDSPTALTTTASLALALGRVGALGLTGAMGFSSTGFDSTAGAAAAGGGVAAGVPLFRDFGLIPAAGFGLRLGATGGADKTGAVGFGGEIFIAAADLALTAPLVLTLASLRGFASGSGSAFNSIVFAIFLGRAVLRVGSGFKAGFISAAGFGAPMNFTSEEGGASGAAAADLRARFATGFLDVADGFASGALEGVRAAAIFFGFFIATFLATGAARLFSRLSWAF